MDVLQPADPLEGEPSSAAKLNRGRDFLRYLRTENINYEGIAMTEVKEYFNTQYSTYIGQISPLERLPTFNSIFKVMSACKEMHTLDSRFFTGPYKTPKIEETTTAGNVGKSSPETGRTKSSDGGSTKKKGKSKKEKKKEKNKNEVRPTPNTESRMVVQTQTFRRRPIQRRIAVDQHMKLREIFVPRPEDGVTERVEGQQYIRKKENAYMCMGCRVDCTTLEDVERHLNSKRHQVVVVIEGLMKLRPKFVQNKYGTNVTMPALESKNSTYYYMDVKPGEIHKSDICIANVNKVPIELCHCAMMKGGHVFEFRNMAGVSSHRGRADIHPGETYKLQLRVQAKAIGTYHAPMMFHFKIDVSGSPVHYHIVRFVNVKCKNSVMEEVKPTSEYKHPPRVSRSSQGTKEIVPGYKLPKIHGDSLQREMPLETYGVPMNIRRMTNRGLKDNAGLNQGEQVELSSLRFVLESALEMSFHERRFRALLYFEEIQMEVDIRKYDMDAVTMAPYPGNNKLLLLQVPGLFESRPSVLKGDWLYVRICEAGGKLSAREYQGFVHEIRLNEVALGFDRSLRDTYMPNMKFSVRFVFNRLPIRLQHRACELSQELGHSQFLFPTMADRSEISLPELKFYNPVIEKNTEQKCAIQNIVAGSSQPAPYIVFGPPGTGKTVTIVEAMKQVHKLSSRCHILACTPSNSAADLITQRLLQHVPRTAMLRLNAVSRSWISVPDTIKCVCNYDKMTGNYHFPSKTELCRYRIIITTLVTAGRLASANFPPGHFTHVFIDEAGHAVEPESLIPIAGVMEVKNSRQIVLAGDPKQLGPILRSPFAVKFGLDVSLLERYMETCDIYQPSLLEDNHKHYDTRVITKLLRNYRSHPEIMKIPNELFYESELVACASIDREKLCHWDELPVQGIPLIFHGVVGEDTREARSPSFFNPEEVSVVVKYVEDLLTSRKGGINIKQADIGVITPYRKQVQKLQQVLRRRHYDDVTVGSVEEFQGQERTVIIVSTVRSRPQYMSLDLHYRLGFLRNPKRFNVTMTRAKALLIVIGNPHTLCKDRHWRTFLHHCRDVGACRGVEVVDPDDEMEDLAERLAAMELIEADNCALPPELVSQYNEHAWRKEV